MLDRLFSFFYKQINTFEKNFSNNACITYFIIQVILLGIVNFLIKFLSNVPGCEIVYIRTVLVYLINFALMTQYGIDPYPEDQRKMRFLIMRGVTTFLCTIFYVLSLKLLSIIEATTLYYTFSIWIGFFAWLLLSEKLSKYEILSSLFGIAGIVFIINPQLIFGSELEQTNDEYYKNIWGILAGLAGAICYTILFILIRRTKTQLHVTIYIQIYNLACLALAPIGVFYQGLYWLDWTEFGLIILMGFIEYVAQLCFNRGIQLEKTGKASIIGYLQIPLSFGIDLILEDVLYFPSIIGAILVFVSSIFMFIKPHN